MQKRIFPAEQIEEFLLHVYLPLAIKMHNDIYADPFFDHF
jgi:hypothetical protein